MRRPSTGGRPRWTPVFFTQDRNGRFAYALSAITITGRWKQFWKRITHHSTSSAANFSFVRNDPGARPTFAVNKSVLLFTITLRLRSLILSLRPNSRMCLHVMPDHFVIQQAMSQGMDTSFGVCIGVVPSTASFGTGMNSARDRANTVA